MREQGSAWPLLLNEGGEFNVMNNLSASTYWKKLNQMKKPTSKMLYIYHSLEAVLDKNSYMGTKIAVSFSLTLMSFLLLTNESF